MHKSTSITTSASRIKPPRGVVAVGRVGWLGIRWGSFAARSIALIVAMLGLIPTMFGLGAGYGLSIHSASAGAGGFYLACLLWGLIIGVLVALVRLIRGSGRWPAESDHRPPWWTRSIVFWPRRRVAGPSQPIEGEDRRPRSEVWFGREARLARWIAGLGLPVLGIALGVGFFAGRVVEQRLTMAVAAAEADDPNWRIDDLMAAREAVPDEENGAIVVGEVIDHLGGDWPPAPPREPGDPAPPPTALQQALDRFPPLGSAARLDDDAATALRDALGEQFAAVELARTVAYYRRGRHELISAANPLETLLPETQAARNAARLLDADAALLALDGQIDAALLSTRAIFGVSRSIGDEPFLISGLVRIAISSVGRNALRRTLAQGEASPEALAAVQAVLLEDRADLTLLTQVRGERATFDALISRIRDGELSIGSLSGGGEDRSPRLGSWGQLWFDYQRAVGLDWMNEAVRIAHRPASERPALLREWQAEMKRTKNGGTLRMLAATLPLLLMPALDAGMAAHARNDAELGASALLVAAERHRLRHGDWPASLDAIDKEILPNPPLDPFTNKPYRMERRDGQILVYSVGPNLRDEHGVCDYKTMLKGGPDDFGTNAWDVSQRRQPPLARDPAPTDAPTP